MRGFDKCCCSAWSCIENPFVLDPVDLHADLHALPAVLPLPALLSPPNTADTRAVTDVVCVYREVLASQDLTKDW